LHDTMPFRRLYKNTTYCGYYWCANHTCALMTKRRQYNEKLCGVRWKKIVFGIQIIRQQVLRHHAYYTLFTFVRLDILILFNEFLKITLIKMIGIPTKYLQTWYYRQIFTSSQKLQSIVIITNSVHFNRY